jgi:metal-responsive CopG/Arc/MetJ family transcriptional regulator
MRTIAITIGDDVLKRIDLLSAEASRSRPEMIREAVQEYLVRIEARAEEKRETKIFKKHRSRLARQAAALVKGQAKS